QDVKILALGDSTNRTAALKTGAIVRMVMNWMEMDQPLAEKSCDITASSCQTAVQPARKAFKSRWMKSKPSINSTYHQIRRKPSNGVSCRSKTRLVRSVFL